LLAFNQGQPGRLRH